MNFSRKIFPIALLVLGSSIGIGAALADSYIYLPEHKIYSKGDETRVIDEAEARRLLAGVSGVDLKDVWFATGGEGYYKSPACVTGRGIWAYTKPVLSSPGVYRGRLSYIEDPLGTQDKPTCIQPQLRVALSVPVASFLNPDTMRPEEAFDGQVPGIFHVSGKESDQQLMNIGAAILKIRDCLKAPTSCPFHIDETVFARPQYDALQAIKLENLTQIDAASAGDGTVHYEVYFSGGSALKMPRAIDIIYKGGTIVDVRADLEIVE